MPISKNAGLLKRSMTCLNLTGKALADMISAHRDDGRATAPETVSRWLNDTNPVDPAVMGWLRELLRNKALALRGSVMQWPPGGSMMLAVTNLKGGVGKTTVSHNLAAVSAFDFHLKTRHISVGESEDTRAAVKLLAQSGVTSEIMSFDAMLTFTPEEHEIVVIDLARDAAYEALDGNPDAFLRSFRPDLYLVPADFGTLFDAHSTRKFADIQGLQGKVRFLHRPRFMSIDFATTASEAGFDVRTESFCPFFIPQTVGSSSHLPARAGADWQSREQQLHFIDLFGYLIEEMGGDITLPGDANDSILAMDTAALLDYVGQWTGKAAQRPAATSN